jgi:hypothetical protein
MPPGQWTPTRSRKLPVTNWEGGSRFLRSAWTARTYTNSTRGAPESESPERPAGSGSSRDRGISTVRPSHAITGELQPDPPPKSSRANRMKLTLPTAKGAINSEEPGRPEQKNIAAGQIAGRVPAIRRSGERRRDGGMGEGREAARGREEWLPRRVAGGLLLARLACWLRPSGRERGRGGSRVGGTAR